MWLVVFMIHFLCTFCGIFQNHVYFGILLGLIENLGKMSCDGLEYTQFLASMRYKLQHQFLIS